VNSARLVGDVHALANAVRTSAAPHDVQEKVASLAREATALLQQYVSPPPYATEQLAPPRQRNLTWNPEDLRRTVPYSPLLGDLNPMAGRAKVVADGGAVRGSIVLSPIHAGPIGTAHGGVVAALFDEMTSLAIMAAARIGYTKTLTVNYLRPTPLDGELSLWAHTAGPTGRIFLTSAEIRHAGKVTASAVAVHRAAGDRDAPVYPE